MTAMLSLIWVFILVLMMMLSDADSVQIIQVSKKSGESVVLEPSLLRMETREDFRWTHLHLLLNNKTIKCHHGRCELLRNGSLSFSQVQPQDSGNYTLEVYDKAGVMKEKKIFLLQVKDAGGSSNSSSSSSSSRTSSLICCMVLLLLLLFFIAFFILRKRRIQMELTSGLKEDNVYTVMHGNHGSKEKCEEQGEEKKEEEPLYVPCHPVITAEQPEDVYV